MQKQTNLLSLAAAILIGVTVSPEAHSACNRFICGGCCDIDEDTELLCADCSDTDCPLCPNCELAGWRECNHQRQLVDGSFTPYCIGTLVPCWVEYECDSPPSCSAPTRCTQTSIVLTESVTTVGADIVAGSCGA